MSLRGVGTRLSLQGTRVTKKQRTKQLILPAKKACTNIMARSGEKKGG